MTEKKREMYPLYESERKLVAQSCLTLCDPIDGSPPGPRSWDSPGKNTGVGCHFLLQCMKVKSECEVAQSCPTLRDPMDCSLPGSPVPGILQAGTLQWVPFPSPSTNMSQVQTFISPSTRKLLNPLRA